MGIRSGPGPVPAGPGPARPGAASHGSRLERPGLPGFRPRRRRRRSQWRSGGPERGSATAEFAVVLPCIVLLLAVVLGAGVCAATSVRAEEAARLAARSAARGDPASTAEQAAREVIGPEARISVGTVGDRASVTVRTRAPGIIGSWGGLEITAEAAARVEPGSRGTDP